MHKELPCDVFTQNYDQIAFCLPKNPFNKSRAEKAPDTFFPALSEIEELTTKYSDVNSIETICSFLEIIRKFYSGNNKTNYQDKLGDYVYILKQQSEALKFCLKLCPDPSYDHRYNPLTKLIIIAKKILIDDKLLDQAILDIKLKPYQDKGNIEINQEEIKYYDEAIKWLKKFTGTEPKSISVIKEIEANAYYYLGKLYESNGSLGKNMPESNWFSAITEYLKALKIDKDCSFIYGNQETIFSGVCEKIGILLFKLGKFYKQEFKMDKQENKLQGAVILVQEAMEYFKVSINTEYLRKGKEILTKILYKQNTKDEPHKELCNLYKNLGEYLLKLNFPVKASYKFDQARSIATPDKKSDLSASALKLKRLI